MYLVSLCKSVKISTMKKALIYFVFASLFTFYTGFAFSQVCNPDPAVIDTNGTGRVAPDTIWAMECMNSNLTLSVICPLTAEIGDSIMSVDHIVVKSLIDKPEWMTYICVPSDCSFPAGIAKCVLINGTPPPGSAGYVYITVLVDVYSLILGSPVCVTCADNPDGYDSGTPLVVWIQPDRCYNVSEYNYNEFGIIAPQPNPFIVATKLGCFTEVPQQICLKVFDLLGTEVYTENIKTNYGENYFTFNGSNLNAGVYFYSVTDEQSRTIIKKFVKSK